MKITADENRTIIIFANDEERLKVAEQIKNGFTPDRKERTRLIGWLQDGTMEELNEELDELMKIPYDEI